MFEHGADQVIYLGPDDALDRLVLEWVGRLVGVDPSEAGLWARAANRCAGAAPDEIQRFVRAERERDRLKALLDEEDILPASILVFGKSREPVVRQVGPRTFVCPGELGTGPAGVGLLSSGPSGELELSFFGPEGAAMGKHTFSAVARAGRFRVLDNGPSSEPA